MITAGRHPRTSTSDRSPTIGGTTPDPGNASAADPSIPATRSRLSASMDIACAVLFVAVGVSAAIPLVWGLALHQTPLAVSAISGELMCVLALLNRWFAPLAAKPRSIPFLAALEERPWVLVACLVCAATSAATLITYWPGTAG